MSTFLAIASFEVRKRIRRISTWVYAVVFFAIAVFFVLAAGGAIQGATVEFGTGGKVFLNSPYGINVLETLIAVFGTPIVAAIAGQATFQDIDANSASLFFTAPISKAQYLFGRFAGALLVCLGIYAAIGLGVAVGMVLPALDAARLGPSFGLMPYVQPYLTVLLPNLFITGALFFALSTLTRRMLPVYAGAVVLLIGYVIALNLSDDVEHKMLVSLLDPFGLLANDRITEYWTIDERNTLLVPLRGIFLYNRLLWCGVAALLAALTYWRFSFTEAAAAQRTRERKVEAQPGLPETASADTLVLPAAALDFSPRARLTLLWQVTRLQWTETVKSVVFLVMLLAGLLFIVSTAQSVGRIFGTPTWPVTYQVLELVGGSFTVFILAIITFYSGELVWRERDAKLDQIHDALPTPSWLVFASKWLALVGVQVVLLAVVMLAGILLQTLQGYHRYELGLYARVLFGMRLVDFATLCTLAMFVHVIVNQKYAGHFVMVGYWVVTIALPLLGFEHRLYRFASNPAWIYSDMNGFGHFLAPIVWFKLYWAALAITMALATNLLWVRGVETGWRFRLRLARQRLRRPIAAGAIAALAVFVGSGAYIYWNTNIKNRYRTQYEEQQTSAAYEQRYKAQYDELPQPRITAVSVHVDVFPEVRRLLMRGTFQIENRSDKPIERIAVNLPERAKIDRLAFGRGERADVTDPEGFYVYALGSPMAPGDKASLDFQLRYENEGFENDAGDLEVVHSGTFVNSTRLPTLGYQRSKELGDDNVRRKHSLPPRARMRDLDDPAGLTHNYVSSDGDWITFDSTVCTSADQIAIAPGYLKDESTSEGRRCFRYEMDARILNFYAWISARFAVRRDAWNDVPIEIYHHPTHQYDLDRMISGVKASLDYFTVQFGPYQHRQVRIIEFPRYQTFAQAFPNTIPYSEAIGFIAKVDEDDPEDVDYPFYVTAHEIAHQWWAHQVIGGDVQGSTVLSESFSQYSALMVMKHAWGDRAMRRFLRYSLDRYLRGRAQERKKELPLMRAEDQNYIHYDKGTLVMYALQDALGEETVNRALRKFLEAHKFQGPPYPNARAFVDVLRREAPQAEALIGDLFEHITLYELRATSATATPIDGGRFEVTVKATAKKLRAGDLGEETEVPIDDEVAFGALDDKGNAMAMKRVRVRGAEVEATFVTEARPAKAGIDPMNVMIDRKPDDNAMPVASP